MDQDRNQDRNQNQDQTGQDRSDANRPNQNPTREPAEGSRDNVRANQGTEGQQGGITNRPVERERNEQAQVPPRGQTKEEDENA